MKTHTSFSYLSLDGHKITQAAKKTHPVSRSHEFTKAAPYKEHFHFDPLQNIILELIVQCETLYFTSQNQFVYVQVLCVHDRDQTGVSSWTASLGKTAFMFTPLRLSGFTYCMSFCIMRSFYCDVHTVCSSPLPLWALLCSLSVKLELAETCFPSTESQLRRPLTWLKGGRRRIDEKGERAAKKFGSPVSLKCLLLLMMKRRWVPRRAGGGCGRERILVPVQHTQSRTDVSYSQYT